MRGTFLLIGVTLALLTGRDTTAYRILLLAPLASRSHNGYFSSVVSTLARHGHEMTFVTPFASKEEIVNVREVVLSEFDVSRYLRNTFEDGLLGVLKAVSLLPTLCADGLQDPRVAQLFDETFDLIMITATGSFCFLKFAHHFQVPLVIVSPLAMNRLTYEVIGNPQFLSYDVESFIDAELPLSFMMRAKNVFLGVFMTLFWKVHVLTRTEAESRRRGLLPDDMPSLSDVLQNSSLVLVNSIRAMETPKTIVPNVIYTGGLHLRPPKPLPQDLEEWVQGAGDHGFIYFSLGSIVNTTEMPEKHRLELVRGMGRLKQRILWKLSEHMEDLPPNVRAAKWLPQQDILAHPKVRLFISHGGINSVQESLYHGVPIVGMPIFSDQSQNVGGGAREGWAYLLHWENLTEESFVATVEAALNDPRLRQKAQKKGAIMKDQPMTPEETVVYWTEYVIRHRGAHHLRCPAADMNWFILYNFDVWITLFLVTCLVVYTHLALLRCCLRRCCRRSAGKNKTE